MISPEATPTECSAEDAVIESFFTDYEARFIKTLDEARQKARPLARSGNPAKRVPAKRLLAEIKTRIAGVVAKASAREDERVRARLLAHAINDGENS